MVALDVHLQPLFLGEGCPPNLVDLSLMPPQSALVMPSSVPALLVLALVNHPPVLHHLALFREGSVTVCSKDVPDLAMNPLDVSLHVELAVGL